MATTELTPSCRLSYLALLDELEQVRYGRFIDSSARDQFLIGRAMLRIVLSKHAAVDPHDWAFGANSYGRPHIVSHVLPMPLHFNLSHTNGLVVLVVGQSAEIGVDVENVTRKLSFDDLAASYFSADEQAVLARAAPDDRPVTFFEIWTLREAYVKARGMGLSLPFNRFQFKIDSHTASLDCLEGCDDLGPRWQFLRMRPTPDHVVALASATFELQRDA